MESSEIPNNGLVAGSSPAEPTKNALSIKLLAFLLLACEPQNRQMGSWMRPESARRMTQTAGMADRWLRSLKVDGGRRSLATSLSRASA